MNISGAIWIETGSYNDLFMRPFKSNASPDIMHQFQEATMGGMNITAPAIAGLAGSIIRPSAAPAGAVSIVNGWGEKRLRFVFEVVSQIGYGSMAKQIVSGYSDHPGVLVHTATASFDPNMRLYFNNSMKLRTVMEDTPNGRVERTMVSDASQILAIPPTAMGSATSMLTMRPQDIYGTMSAQMLDQSRGEIYDHRSTFLEGVKKSRRSNSNAPDYIARMLQSAHTAVNNPGNYTQDAGQIYNAARDMSKDQYVHADQFLGRLMRETNYGHDGFITFGQLQRMFPELDMVSQVAVRGQAQRIGGPVIERGASEYWHGTSTEAMLATSLCHSVPGLMMDMMISKLVFIATNEIVGTDYLVEIREIAGFAKDVDMSPYAAQLIQRLKQEILADITSNNQITFRLQMNVNVIGDTFVKVSYAGGYDTEFVMPSFCDALASPMLTNQSLDLNTMARDMDELYNFSIGVSEQFAQATGQTDNRSIYNSTPLSPPKAVKY